jgi:hypothetical protein
MNENYNIFRQDIQNEIEYLQLKLPHLGKFYFDEEYDFYDNHSLYYIYYQNQADMIDKVYFSESFKRIWEKYKTQYTFLISREPYEVCLNRMIGVNVL